MKQTAIEWLLEQMQTKPFTQQNATEILDKAKEMEKQQIIDAYERGDKYKSEPPGTDYYKETFNK